jgi:SAM-dependent methyltransferase
MGKGAYGTVEFWDEYYVDDRPEPYDWFFEWEYIAPTLTPLLAFDARILVVGCGNSPFSAELFAHGYRKQLNVDNCELVVQQQRERYPMLEWRVADVRRLDELPDGAFDVVLDKGLLDNLYCYVDTADAVREAVGEMRRVLRPDGGRLVVFSCHAAAEVLASLRPEPWALEHAQLRNPRYPEVRVPTYLMVVCTTGDTDAARATPFEFVGALGADELAQIDAGTHPMFDAAAPLPAAAPGAAGATTITPPPAPSSAPAPSLPAPLQRLERRASGIRHHSLVLEGGGDDEEKG